MGRPRIFEQIPKSMVSSKIELQKYTKSEKT